MRFAETLPLHMPFYFKEAAHRDLLHTVPAIGILANKLAILAMLAKIHIRTYQYLEQILR